jgi:hypothetical protein
VSRDASQGPPSAVAGPPSAAEGLAAAAGGPGEWSSDPARRFRYDLPDDLDTSERYIAVPHKNDLDLGRNLALRFAAEQLPHQCERIEGFFRHRGAYARFKDLLASEGCLEQWYAFEAESTERALRDWCEANEIRLAEPGSQPSVPQSNEL